MYNNYGFKAIGWSKHKNRKYYRKFPSYKDSQWKYNQISSSFSSKYINNMRFKHKMLSLQVQNPGKLCIFLYYKSKNIEFSPFKMIKSQSSTLSICFCYKTNLTMTNFRCRYNRSAKLEKNTKVYGMKGFM